MLHLIHLNTCPVAKWKYFYFNSTIVCLFKCYYIVSNYQNLIIYSTACSANNKENVELRITGPLWRNCAGHWYYSDVTMGTTASWITSLIIIYSTVYSDADQRKHQSSASLAFVRGIHRGPVNSPHKWPVTRKKFPFDDVIMDSLTKGL